MRKSSWLYLWGAALFLLFLVASPVLGCSCNLKHPQEHVCESDFVLSARIRRPKTTPDGLTAYKIRVKRIFKMTDKAHLALAKKLIYTIPGQCEARLSRRTNYAIAGDVAGGKVWISACSFVQPWRTLAPKMKKGIRLLYQTGCDCPIMSCHWWERCPPGDFFCPWETTREEEDCQARHGVCLRRPNGSCSWLGGRLYRTCMRNRTSTFQEGSPNDIIASHYGRRLKRPRFRNGLKLHKSLYKNING